MCGASAYSLLSSHAKFRTKKAQGKIGFPPRISAYAEMRREAEPLFMKL
jgi:hypothetical protein